MKDVAEMVLLVPGDGSVLAYTQQHTGLDCSHGGKGAAESFESIASLTGLHLLVCVCWRLQRWASFCQGWVSLLLLCLWWFRIDLRLVGRSLAWTLLSFHKRSHLWHCYPSLPSPGGFQKFLRALLLTRVSWSNYENAHCYFLKCFQNSLF